MTDHSDYPGDMADKRLNERDIDALLGGRPIGDADLESFVQGLRSMATAPPPVPAAELASLFQHGLEIDHQQSPAAIPAARAAGLPRVRRGIRLATQLSAAVVAKVAALGLTAKSALALTAAGATLTAAGAAGVLPQQAHDALDRVIPVQVGALDDSGAEAVSEEDTELVDESEDGTVEDGAAVDAEEGRPEQPGAASQDGLDRAAENDKAAERIPSSTGPGTGEEMRERNAPPAAADRKPATTPTGSAGTGDDAAESGADNADAADDADDAAEAGAGNAAARDDAAESGAGNAAEDAPAGRPAD